MISKAYSTWRGYDWAGPLFTYQGRDLGTSNGHAPESLRPAPQQLVAEAR